MLFFRNAGLHPLGRGCSLLYRQQRAGISPPRAGSRNGKIQSLCTKQAFCKTLYYLSVLISFQVVKYLAGCGLQSCPMLLAKGYPDIGWNPCGGEKYLDFLRFAVFVNGLIYNLFHIVVFNSVPHVVCVFSLLLMTFHTFFLCIL